MTRAFTDDGLEQYVSNWLPSSTEARDVVSASRAREFAATLDLDDSLAEGDDLPPLWQWAYFADWPMTADLGSDGHPRAGHFLPPIPDRRRMFAGGRITIVTPLVIGEEAVRQSSIVRKAVKQGRTGELFFVTVRHDYRQAGRLRMTEEQDLVYRSDSGTSMSFTPVAEELGPQTEPWGFVPAMGSPLLFRFSALTANAHRIHYDEAYATQIEGFPGLVVHGPLLAVYMAELARLNVGSIRTFDFRLSRPVFLNDRVRVQGGPSKDWTSAELAVVSGSGAVHATASVNWEEPDQKSAAGNSNAKLKLCRRLQ